MAIMFRDFRFENTNGIPVSVTLEAPPGSIVLQRDVVAGGNLQSAPSLSDIGAVKVSISAPDHADSETLEVGGTTVGLFIETLSLRGQLFAMSGEASVKFGAL